MKVRVRYAPSPTGIPHVGNIRTALFNYLFARNQNGDFILRIEDTDQARLVPESIGKIKESLELLNLKWDEEHIQSQRLNTYKKHLEELKTKGLAYEDEGAWRFKVPQSKVFTWEDVVHGSVEFKSDVVEDFVIVKSDTYPTYHFASVVDDHYMQITHVFRGDEWISSTPKHLMLYEALGWEPPIFVHLPAILGESKKKLSKREGAHSVIEYVKDGYLPEALINFLALLGWAPKGDRELFTLEELTKEFTLERINKNSPIFNLQKLEWFNKKYLQTLDIKGLASKVKSFSQKAKTQDEQKLTKILVLIRDRMTTLADFEKYASIFFEKGKESPPEKSKVQKAKEAIESVSNWDEKTIAKELNAKISETGLEPSEFKNTLRLSIFADNTPPIYESLAVLTKDEVLKRIDEAL